MNRTIFLLFIVAFVEGIDIDEDDGFLSRFPLFNSILKKKPIDLQKMDIPCTCGIFLEGQLSKNGDVPINENPVFSKESESSLLPCGIQGNRQCLKKCIEMVFNYMPNMGPLVCATIERECIKEKPYLFIRNCESTWRNTGFSAGKEFCCDNGLETRCGIGAIQTKAALKGVPINIAEFVQTASSKKSVPEVLFGVFDRATDVFSDVLRLNQ